MLIQSTSKTDVGYSLGQEDFQPGHLIPKLSLPEFIEVFSENLVESNEVFTGLIITGQIKKNRLTPGRLSCAGKRGFEKFFRRRSIRFEPRALYQFIRRAMADSRQF